MYEKQKKKHLKSVCLINETMGSFNKLQCYYYLFIYLNCHTYIVSDHVCPFLLAGRIRCNVTKLRSSTWFLKRNSEFTVLK